MECLAEMHYDHALPSMYTIKLDQIFEEILRYFYFLGT